MRILEILVQEHGVRPEDAIILTHYRAQKKLIAGKLMEKPPLKENNVSTIVLSQGMCQNERTSASSARYARLSNWNLLEDFFALTTGGTFSVRAWNVNRNHSSVFIQAFQGHLAANQRCFDGIFYFCTSCVGITRTILARCIFQLFCDARSSWEILAGL